MSARGWVRTRVVDAGHECFKVIGEGSYAPGDEVIVMPAEDADEMLQLLEYAPIANHPISRAWGARCRALLARLAPTTEGGEVKR